MGHLVYISFNGKLNTFRMDLQMQLQFNLRRKEMG